MKKHIVLIIGIIVIIALAIGIAINNHNNQDKPVSELPIVGGNNGAVESTPPVESDPIIDEPTPALPEDSTPQKDPNSLPIAPDEMDNPEADPTDKNDSEGNSEPQDTSEQEYVENNAGLPTEDKIEDVEIQEDVVSIPEIENPEELTEEQQKALQELLENLEKLENITTPNNPTTPSEPPVEPVTPAEKTDAEVKAAIDEFVATFDNLDNVDLTWFCDEGIEHLQDNLDIIQNHPEDSKAVSAAIRYYKSGSYDYDEFIGELITWLEGGGLYGGNIIVSH